MQIHCSQLGNNCTHWHPLLKSKARLLFVDLYDLVLVCGTVWLVLSLFSSFWKVKMEDYSITVLLVYWMTIESVHWCIQGLYLHVEAS